MDFNKDLIVLYSKQYDAQLLTIEAYETIRSNMDHEDIQTHQVLFIDPAAAALIFENCLTKEEVLK